MESEISTLELLKGALLCACTGPVFGSSFPIFRDLNRLLVFVDSGVLSCDNVTIVDPDLHEILLW